MAEPVTTYLASMSVEKNGTSVVDIVSPEFDGEKTRATQMHAKQMRMPALAPMMSIAVLFVFAGGVGDVAMISPIYLS